MSYVDSAVLDLVERLCQRFQRWTGRTNIWIAFQFTNLSIVVYFGWAAVLYWLNGLFALRVFIAGFCGAVFFMLTRTTFRQSVDTSELQAYKRVTKGLRNPRRVRDAQLRIAFLTVSCLLPGPVWMASLASGTRFMLTTELLAVLTTAVLYMLACDPLPPQEGRLFDWVRSMGGSRAEAASPLELRGRQLVRIRTSAPPRPSKRPPPG